MDAEEIVVTASLIFAIGIYMFEIVVFSAPLWLCLLLAACVVAIFFMFGGSHTVGYVLMGLGIISLAYPVVILTGSYTLQALVLIAAMVPLRMAWRVYRKTHLLRRAARLENNKQGINLS